MNNLENSKMTDPEMWPELHGPSLTRYATGRVRNKQAAEDLVQETFIAALKSRKNFSGRSSERSWFIGILKHKMIDFFRKDSREQSVSNFDFNSNYMKNNEASWNVLSSGSSPSELPDNAAQEKGFYSVLIQCLSQLPENLSKAFVLREIRGLETKEVCNILGISSSNLWVRLHRAKAALKPQLKVKWMSV